MSEKYTVGRVRVYSRVPASYSSRGTVYGSNAEIYQDTVSELEARASDIKELHLALYLFNNAYLYRKLLEIANGGATVVVTSIPLTGYDPRKTGGAKEVYSQALKDGKIDLRIFPHMYVWYGAEYAGGGATYSFHIKAGLMEYSDGTCTAFLTSGNLALGDPTHSETAAFIEAPRKASIIQAFKSFFGEIEKRAKPFGDYNKLVGKLPSKLQQVFDFCFVGGASMVNFSQAQASHAFFAAPFLTIERKGSSHYARERLIDVILHAKRRLLVCTQHSHDISPFNGYQGQTMIGSITEAKKANPSIDVRVLKQVASSGLADKRRAAFVEGHLYHAGVPQRVNRLIHDKFIVADDTTVISTGNFTATQFGWGQRVMEYKTSSDDLNAVQKVVDSANSFFATPKGCISVKMTRPKKKQPRVKVSKRDVFSEINAYVIIESSEVADRMAKYFDILWSHNLSTDVEVPT